MSPKTPTLAENIRAGVENRLGDVHVLLPAKVTKYDRQRQKVDAQPLIRRFQEGADGETISEPLPVISNIPVAFPRAGGFKITLPIETGDLVTLLFCETSIDAHQIGPGRDPVSPDLFQRFDLTDAIAIPGWYPDGKRLTDIDANNLVIAKDGGAAIHVAPERVELYQKRRGSIITGAAIHIGDDLVNLYEASADQFVALAQKTFDAIDGLRGALASFIAPTYNSHTHAYLPGPGVSVPTGPPIPTGSSPPTTPSVAATKVKAT